MSVSTGAPPERVILPAAVQPSKYKLSLEPYLDVPAENQKPDDAFTFDGKVDIDVSVSEPVTEIVLNALELKVASASVTSMTSEVIEVSDIVMDVEGQTVSLKLGKTVSEGRYTVGVTFSGCLNDKMAGFYRSGYKDADTGEPRFMAVTQFEPTDARRSFPCFDEPAHKAIFEVTLVAPAKLQCISNMPIASERTLDNGKKIVAFKPSPIMSTYLLAYVVGEFDFVEGTTEEGVLIRVYTLRNQSHQGKFALDVALKTLSFYTKFFEIEYPLPKLDMIAVPDFSAGAMENWGCVTYRETALLLDPENSSAAAKSRVAEVVAHELAHQWFGNLVTMEWWTDLWLNEGFATWCADLAVDTLFPDWQTWVQFVGGTLSGALRLDALRSSHPIEVQVNAAQEVNEIFDHISYFKGASVIRMLANFLTVETFRKGLVAYLNKFKYQNAVTEDLWIALERESGKPIAAMMRSWTKQTGYPLLSLSAEGGKLSVTQKRFLSDGKISEEEAEATWIVPIGYYSAGAPDKRNYSLMEGPSLELGGDGTSSAAWVKLNEGQSGVFRVRYTPEMYKKLVEPIRSGALNVEDRLGLLMDAMALVRAGEMPASDALDVLSAFDHEEDYTCVSKVIGSLSEIKAIFGGDAEIKAGIDRFACKLLSHASGVVGWEAKPDEKHVVSLMRNAVLTALQSHGDAETLEVARARFAKFLEDPKSLAADLRVPVYFAVMSSGGEKEFDTLVSLHDNSELNEEKVRCIRALGEVPTPALLERYLAWGSECVKPQDLLYVVACAGTNPVGEQITWDFLKEQWNSWIEKYGSGNFLLTRFIESATASFKSEARAQEVEAYFKTVQTTGVERKLAQCLEAIRVRTAWLERDREAVAAWLASA